MPEERFVRLVEENGGFEFYQAYANDVDHVLGGKGNVFWYTVMKKGRVTESWAGKLSGGVWEDTYTKGAKTKSMPSGTTIALIEEKAYLMQDEKWVKDRKPKPVEDAHPRFHYVYGFGDRAVDVSQEYGVTIAFSDIRDPAAGFHLRYLYTGNDVELP
ncbi:MAG: hypothetical protein K6D94_06000 [Clostridiales bacterium]|nr:hypothetical protein [Clostridiales bacterium]